MQNLLQEVPVQSDIFTTTGVVTILAAIGALVTTLFTAYISIKAKNTTNEVKKANLDQVKKLDNITILVDGRYSAVLQELADVKQLLAVSTGKTSDLIDASKAQDIANKQEKLIDSISR